ncbi:MAG: cupin domain-containing protein [Burkholderiaceae bacterium]|nr:cupin domain-containing protein [Burkholderiaceae bacterium]
MQIDIPTPLLGGLSPQAFMRRHWQKKPLLIRQALPEGVPELDRAALFALAATDGVESRLIERRGANWKLRHGPFTRRQLPPLTRPDWTLLVQGVDLHAHAAHRLMSRFRFASDVRLDDVMISFATDGGGVGPHFDSYDVFLLQLAGRRRWRVGRMTNPVLQTDVPLKIIENFESEHEWTLEAGDMLYLPPRWAHDGVAEGDCLTASIGFRAPSREEVGSEVLQRMLDGLDDHEEGQRYRDPAQSATQHPARIPAPLADFAADAVRRIVDDPRSLDCALGEWLSEPKPQTWFDPVAALPARCAVLLDRRTRMLYDEQHVFINGESFVASGRDAKLMRVLADVRALDAASVARLGDDAWELLQSWAFQGWLRAADVDD